MLWYDLYARSKQVLESHPRRDLKYPPIHPLKDPLLSNCLLRVSATRSFTSSVSIPLFLFCDSISLPKDLSSMSD